jgi:long-subunit fatty acid transport protein
MKGAAVAKGVAVPLVGVALAAAVAVGSASRAEASPLDDPFIGGLSFTGPTSASVSSIYWNPAALGLVRGTQVMIAGTLRLSSTTVSRSSGGSATANDVSQPVSYPLGPGAFMGISSDLGGDRFTIGFATYMPFVQQTTFAISPNHDEPTRYQALQVDLRNLALAPALSIRFGDVRVGIAPGFMFSTGHLRFAEDTALDTKGGLARDCGGGQRCDNENLAAAARYDVYSGHGLGDAKFSVTIGAGAYYRRGNLELGLAYQSRPIGADVAGVEVAGEHTTVEGPPLPDLTPPTKPCATTAPGCVFGDLSYRLPDVWIGGITYRLHPGFEVSVMARWIWWHLHDRLDVRLTGPTLEASGIPEHVVLYRGFHDVWDLRGRVSYWFRERVRLGGQLRLETSAVDPSAVNAAAVDGFKVEPMALVSVRLFNRFWLDAGYGVTLMSAVTVDNSAFDPTAATKCADGGGNLELKECAARNAGQGRPTAAGTYTRFSQDFGVALTAKF